MFCQVAHDRLAPRAKRTILYTRITKIYKVSLSPTKKNISNDDIISERSLCADICRERKQKIPPYGTHHGTGVSDPVDSSAIALGNCPCLAPTKNSLEEAKMPPLTDPKVEQATKSGIVQDITPNNRLPNVCGGRNIFIVFVVTVFLCFSNRFSCRYNFHHYF